MIYTPSYLFSGRIKRAYPFCYLFGLTERYIQMTFVSCFKPLVADNTEILILGSMPGEMSLKMNQYYAHSRNSFWFILSELFGIDADSDYEIKKKWIKTSGIAIWDVLKHCQRSGSLDSAIDTSSVIVNNFQLFFTENTGIRYVFFNGAKAEALYKKHVMSEISAEFKYLKYHRLPSTSPAFAAMRPQEKLTKWEIIKEKLKHRLTD